MTYAGYYGNIAPMQQSDEGMPEWARKFLTETTISAAEASQITAKAHWLTDEALANEYRLIPVYQLASIYADLLEAEIVNRFCRQHA